MGKVRHGRWSRGHRRAARNPQRIPSGAGPPTPGFGEACEYVFSNALLQSTDIVNWTTYVSLTTPVLGGGNYFGSFRGGYQNGANNADIEVRSVIDLGLPGENVNFQVNGQTDGLGIGKTMELNQFQQGGVFTLPAGARTFTVQFRLDPSSGTPGMDDVAMYWGCIEFWSFN